VRKGYNLCRYWMSDNRRWMLGERCFTIPAVWLICGLGEASSSASLRRPKGARCTVGCRGVFLPNPDVWCWVSDDQCQILYNEWSQTVVTISSNVCGEKGANRFRSSIVSPMVFRMSYFDSALHDKELVVRFSLYNPSVCKGY
jgi:hypothetical protein